MAKKDKCIFCGVMDGTIDTDKIDDAENFIVSNDPAPVSEGHCVIISKKHYEAFWDMLSSLGPELMNLIKKHSLRLIKEGKADGIKLVNNNYKASGQMIPHFHLHVIPEKQGKTRERHV
jgi:histidine triad (HIT) family protein